MGKANKTRKFAAVKRMINPNDNRLKIAEASKPKEFKRGKDDKTVKVTEKNKKTTKLN